MPIPQFDPNVVYRDSHGRLWQPALDTYGFQTAVPSWMHPWGAPPIQGYTVMPWPPGEPEPPDPDAPPEPLMFGDIRADAALRAIGARQVTADRHVATRRPVAVEGLNGSPPLLVEGAKAVLFGNKKTTRSELSLNLAVALATGLPVGGLLPTRRPYRVMLISPENDDGTQEGRLELVKAVYGIKDAPNLVDMTQRAAKRMDFSLPEGGGYSQSRDLVLKVIETSAIEWLFLDPLYDMVGRVDFANSQGGGKEILSWLTQVQSLGCTPVISAMEKNGQPYGDMIFGYWLESSVRTQRADVTGHPELADITYTVSAIRDGYGTGKIRFRGEGHGRWVEHQRPSRAVTDVADEAEAAPREPIDKEARDARVRDYLAEHPDATAREVAAATDVPKSTVFRLMRPREGGEE